MHLRKKSLLIVSMAVLWGGLCRAQPNVVAYYPAWLRGTLPAEMVEYENITHINVAFAWPLSNGTIVDYPELPYPDLVTQAHLAGKKILPSMGGWGQSSGFPPMSADSIARASFVQNLVYYIQSNEYDGVDLDWEFPETVTDRANQILLVRDIRNAFDANGQDWIISMAVSLGDWYGRWSDYPALSQ